ncbi:MAG: folate-binding protein [Pseudomonadota bacterium]
MTAWLGLAADWRACLVMQGADARAVLQGVVTNDVDRVAGNAPVYAALLTPQGKYLFDFILSERADGAIRIDCEAVRAQDLAKRLKLYCLRRDARVEVEGEIKVGLLWAHGAAPRPGSAKEAVILPDPRDPSLGNRVYAPDPARVLAALGAEPATLEAYTALRVSAGVPESGAELVPDNSYILEAGFERLHGVDFRKGCYVGQEVTARMKHKTELKKRLVRVAVEGAAPLGTAIVNADGKPAGTLFSQADGEGLAHLRLDRSQGELLAEGAKLTVLV